MISTSTKTCADSEAADAGSAAGERRGATIGAAVEGRMGVVFAPEEEFPAAAAAAADVGGTQHDVDGEEPVCTKDAAKSLWALSP